MLTVTTFYFFFPFSFFVRGVVVVLVITNRSGWLLELLTELINRLNCQINTALAVGFVTNQAASKREQAANFVIFGIYLKYRDKIFNILLRGEENR